MTRVPIPLALLLLAVSFTAEDKKDAPATIKRIGNAAPTGAAVKEIEVSAKKYEFNPATIEIPVNTLVKLHLKATDREHGFELKSVKNSCVKFDPKTPATLEYYADKAGEYEFNCCKRCGLGHGRMKGKLIVK